MKNLILKLSLFLCIVSSAIAQKTNSSYAIMDAKDAIALQLEIPDEIIIFETKNNQSAVYISEAATLELKTLTLHGPGYVFKPSLEKALYSLYYKPNRQQDKVINFTITEDVLVNQAIEMVNGDNIENDILNLEGYGTRYHTRATATQAVYELKDRWEAMALATERTDIDIRIFNHADTDMPSVIMTIEGAETPEDYIIIGGHMDSVNFLDFDDAPGADDNASGIATIIEISRVLFEMDFIPKKTVEFMAFAAEEIGLVGSSEIAEEYSNNGINVEAFVQFDTNNYAGSVNDIYITTDSYNSTILNGFLINLMEHYNSSGDHQFTYGTTECNYGCSDHFSWAQQGYDVAFPFEASDGEYNPFLHSSQDTYNIMGNTDHATKFTKLGLEFIIEAAKSSTLAINDFSDTNFSMFISEKQLIYNLKNSNEVVSSLMIFDATGKKIVSRTNLNYRDKVSLQNLSEGFYIAVFKFENQQYVTKKFILK